MFEKIFIFIIFLAPLIFFHELGHFFFARLFGVRVEVFSIGFGPKILKYIHKGTEYAVSIIPLGGYVKMFGDDPFSEVQLTEEEKKVAFNHKSKVARFWIVFGGPLANLILAYFLYVGLLVGGEKFPESKIGIVPEKSVFFEKGIRSGDTLVGINDEKVLRFDDLNIKSSEVEKIKVKRNNKIIELPINMKIGAFIDGFVEIISLIRKPIFVNAKGEKHLLTLSQKPTAYETSLEEIISNYQGRAFLYKILESDEGISLDEKSELEVLTEPDISIVKHLNSLNFFSIDLQVRNVVMSSPADKAKIKKGDILLSLNGNKLITFDDLKNSLQTIEEGNEVGLEFLSQGQTIKKNVTPEIREIENKKIKIVGIESSVEYIRPKLIVAKEENLFKALISAFGRTSDGIVKTFNGYKKLITREVSLNNIGGPLAIGKVATDSFNISLSMFFSLMAIISINLGVINLFPIPVLDGGHIMFLIFEVINRGPLSRRKLEFAQRLGMSVLFLLIFVALFNDISRLF